MLDLKWTNILKNLEISFEPLVSTNTANTFALNVRFKNFEQCGNYYSIQNLFDDAFEDKVLYQFDIELRKLTFKKYKDSNLPNSKIIYPIDNRLMYMPDYRQGNTDRILEKLQLNKEKIYIQISDRDSIKDPNSIKNIISSYKTSGFNIVLNDFGVSMSSLQLLYFAKPKMIKLDTFFSKEIETSIKKRNFLKSLIELAHSMEISVGAKKVESKEAYYLLKELGIDYVEGALVSLDLKALAHQNQIIEKLNTQDKRMKQKNRLNDDYIQTDLSPLSIDASLHELFSYFQKNTSSSFVPVINHDKSLVGVIHEVDIKKISYSQYGLALAKNDSFGAKLTNYIKPAPWVEKTWGIDKALEIYNQNDNNKGIFVTIDGQYWGFISVKTLLELSYKRNLQIAQSQNPLTKLPGNSMIETFIQNRLKNVEKKIHFVYFDFDDFKPFNDSYGFRQGDRAILLFSDLLKKLPSCIFKAHIGGDDFFIGFENFDYDAVYVIVEKLCCDFKNQVSSLYKQKDRENGYIKVKDRFGIKREFDLLSVSAAIVELKQFTSLKSLDHILSSIKKESKKSNTPVGVSILLLTS